VTGATLPGRLTWRVAKVADVVNETSRVRSLSLDIPDWPGHLAGQHVDIRLTAEDGYQAQRSYSIASAPGDPMVVLTVERLDEGEVSPYLFDVLQPGDELELRGPIGGYFVWTEAHGGPLLLVAGGSGIVPLRAMLRHRIALRSTVPVRLFCSARSASDIIYREELERVSGRDAVEVFFTLTRDWPTGWTGYRRRIDSDLLREIAWPPAERPLVYICGPTGFVETAANGLVQLRYDPARIRTERFGPTGV
jgi:ferredoxin-NADP reductase